MRLNQRGTHRQDVLLNLLPLSGVQPFLARGTDGAAARPPVEAPKDGPPRRVNGGGGAEWSHPAPSNHARTVVVSVSVGPIKSETGLPLGSPRIANNANSTTATMIAAMTQTQTLVGRFGTTSMFAIVPTSGSGS